MKKYLAFLVALTTAAGVSAQRPYAIHSHNDYDHIAPFWEAYSQHCASIEADVYLQDDLILVAHNRKDIRPERNLRDLYFEPVALLFRSHGGKMWEDSDQRLQLVIDLKEPQALPGVLALAREYPDVFTGDNGVQLLIGGEMPASLVYDDYPSWVWFIARFSKDGKLNYTPAQLKRIAVVSANFRQFAPAWDGKGEITDSERDAVAAAIRQAHEAGKPIRFWNTPRGDLVYQTLYQLGADVINTDHPARCAAFFKKLTAGNP